MTDEQIQQLLNRTNDLVRELPQLDRESVNFSREVRRQALKVAQQVAQEFGNRYIEDIVYESIKETWGLTKFDSLRDRLVKGRF